MKRATENTSPRKIIHIDMDAFYASVEQRDNPALAGKPVAVGGSQDRGVVAAASYEARQFGVRSAMSSKVAYQKCPDIIFVKPRFEVYKQVSGQIRQVFLDYTDLVEPLSLDEAYLDVTVNHKNIGSAVAIARQIKAKIKEITGLTASAGVSVNKFIAKIASAYQKPNGLTVVLPEQAAQFVAGLAIDKFYGVGRVTAQRMHALGIHTGLDLKAWAEPDLVTHFGKAGRFYYQIARGIDERLVNAHRIRKSIGVENTYAHDLVEPEQIKTALDQLAEELLVRIQRNQAEAYTLTLKVKFTDFQQITRSKTVAYSLTQLEAINVLTQRLTQEVPWQKPVRLLGLSVASLNPTHETGQLSLF